MTEIAKIKPMELIIALAFLRDKFFVTKVNVRNRFPQSFALGFDLPEGFPSNVCLVYFRKLANKNSRT